MALKIRKCTIQCIYIKCIIIRGKQTNKKKSKRSAVTGKLSAIYIEVLLV